MEAQNDMKKCFLILTALIAGLLVVCTLVVCTVERNNPLDENGDNFDPPTVKFDTLETSVKANDTTHFDTVKISLIRNKPESRFKHKLDSSSWTTEWDSLEHFRLNELKDGKHTIHIKTMYEGGLVKGEDSLIFYVQVNGYKPSYTVKSDTSIVVDTGAILSIVASSNGKAPFTYQWLKSNSTLTNRISDTLSIIKIGISDTGAYRCIAKNLYGTDTSRTFKVSLLSKPIDTTRYMITIETTKGGSVNRNPNKTDFLTSEVLIVKAIADSGYEFDHWEGDMMSDSDSLSLTITKALTFRAVFSPIISGSCVELKDGDDIAKAIRAVISTQKQGIICVKTGLYNGKAVRIAGNLKIVVK